MRLFLALAIDDAARAAIGEAVDGVARKLAETGAGGAVKSVPRENLHVTLRFLGEVGDADAPTVVSALGPPLADAPFDMVLGGGGCFPGGGVPRVVWLGVSAGAETVQRIYAELDRRLADFDVE